MNRGVWLNLFDSFRDSFLFRTARWLQWQARGGRMPAPHPIKAWTIRKLLRGQPVRVFIETGTLHGRMIHSLRNSFDKVISIELSEDLARKARERFKNDPRVNILIGDSAVVMPQVLAELKEPAFFWLDAHYSAGETAKADIETPIVAELQTLAKHPVKNHYLLIDDARCFDGTHDYPTLDGLRKLTSELFPNHGFEVVNDMIAVFPNPPSKR